MAFPSISQETRIIAFIAIDLVFFFVEIICGYSANSLALVADAFHMLNDIFSLFVGLWAARVANQESSNEYTYGWARAELLGGFMNGVFLIALCLSIFLDAIQRFFDPQVIKNPTLVGIVGVVGLVFNIIGLVVFHQHSHSHGEAGDEEGHAHSHTDPLSSEEHGHSHSPDGHSHGVKGYGSDQAIKSSQDRSRAMSISFQVDGENRADGNVPRSAQRGSISSIRRTTSQSHAYNFSTHPYGIRQGVHNTAEALMSEPDLAESDAGSIIDNATGPNGSYGVNEEHDRAEDPTESSPLLLNGQASPRKTGHKRSRSGQVHGGRNGALVDHTHHKHAQPGAKSKATGGHSHGDMNIRGIFLHVLGDALSNLGVVAVAVVVRFSTWPGKVYFDPAISLVTTCILLKTAIPLCKDTARPLLQATPQHISVDEIKEDISSLPGVRSCHHVHVWQLTPSKYIATLDVHLDFDFDNKNSARYMDIAREIKRCLHGYGIHSSTVQPEFLQPGHHDHNNGHSSSVDQPGGDSAGLRRMDTGADSACLLNCGDECVTGRQCCGPGKKNGSDSGH